MMLNLLRNTAGSTDFCASRVISTTSVREACGKREGLREACGKAREGAGSTVFRGFLPANCHLHVGLTVRGNEVSAAGATRFPRAGNVAQRVFS